MARSCACENLGRGARGDTGPFFSTSQELYQSYGPHHEMAAAAAEGPKTLFSLVVRDAEKLKKLWAAFNFLSRVGKDLILEAEGDWLKLRALNESKTAYSVVELESSFFGPHGVLLHPDIDTFSCRVNLRQLCAVCKNLSKTSERVTIRAESAADNSYQLVVEMQSKDTGILRLHRLQYSDCEVIDAVFEDQGASRLQASNKIFNQMLSNMYQSPEIAVLPTQDEFKVRSFHAIDHGQDKKHVTTDLNIETQDFDFYECKEEGNRSAGGGRGGGSSSACSGPGGDGTNDVADSDSQVEANRSKKELVFCVRELKAILGLCDSIGNENFNMYWTTAGMPVKFECKTPGLGFTGTVILTTVVQRTQFPSSAAGNAAIAGSGAASASATNGNGKKRSSGASNKAGGGSKKKATTTSAAPAEDDDEMDVQPTRGRGSGKGKRRVEDDDDDDDDE